MRFHTLDHKSESILVLNTLCFLTGDKLKDLKLANISFWTLGISQITLRNMSTMRGLLDAIAL